MTSSFSLKALACFLRWLVAGARLSQSQACLVAGSGLLAFDGLFLSDAAHPGHNMCSW